MTRRVTADASFEKYESHGAYHWRETGRHLIGHNAFTAERYRTVADRSAPVEYPTFEDGLRQLKIIEAVVESSGKHAWLDVR